MTLAPVSVTVAASAQPVVAGEGLEVASTAAIYRTDAVVRRAPALQSHPLNTAPRIVLNATDAARLQLQEGQMAKVGTDAGKATLPVVVAFGQVLPPAVLAQGTGSSMAASFPKAYWPTSRGLA